MWEQSVSFGCINAALADSSAVWGRQGGHGLVIEGFVTCSPRLSSILAVKYQMVAHSSVAWSPVLVFGAFAKLCLRAALAWSSALAAANCSRGTGSAASRAAGLMPHMRPVAAEPGSPLCRLCGVLPGILAHRHWQCGATSLIRIPDVDKDIPQVMRHSSDRAMHVGPFAGVTCCSYIATARTGARDRQSGRCAVASGATVSPIERACPHSVPTEGVADTASAESIAPVRVSPLSFATCPAALRSVPGAEIFIILIRLWHCTLPLRMTTGHQGVIDNVSRRRMWSTAGGLQFVGLLCSALLARVAVIVFAQTVRYLWVPKLICLSDVGRTCVGEAFGVLVLWQHGGLAHLAYPIWGFQFARDTRYALAIVRRDSRLFRGHWGNFARVVLQTSEMHSGPPPVGRV